MNYGKFSSLQNKYFKFKIYDMFVHCQVSYLTAKGLVLTVILIQKTCIYIIWSISKNLK